jgi:chaperonin GroES
MKAVGNGVVVEVEDPEKVSRGGIIIPDTANATGKKPVLIGKIVSVGEGRYLENGMLAPIRVDVGDRVIFPSFAGYEFEVEGRKLRQMVASEVLVKL